MVELVELNCSKHKNLNVRFEHKVELASKQHILKIRVAEVAKAVTSLPVFFIKDQHNAQWLLSALSSFEVGQNLLVENNQWQSTFQPTSMQTPPFYLMQSTTQSDGYSVGILESSDAFTKDQGEALFDDKGKETSYVSQIKKLLEADIKADHQTYHFIKKLDEMGLLKPIDLQVQYIDEAVNTLHGLHTINEDVLHSLTPEKLHELNQVGYLIPIHAMLISLFQLNLLVRKNNEVAGLKKVKQIKIAIAKDRLGT